MNTFKYVIILGDGTRIDSYDEYCEEGLFESYSEAENEAIIEMESFENGYEKFHSDKPDDFNYAPDEAIDYEVIQV